MILEQEIKGNQKTFINETTAFKYKIYFEKRGMGDERRLEFNFVFQDNESNHHLFELDSDEIKYEFLYSMCDSKKIEEEYEHIEEEDENTEEFENFIKKFYIDTFFIYDKILKVFRCFLSNQNKFLFNKTNFLNDLGEELKVIFNRIKDKSQSK